VVRNFYLYGRDLWTVGEPASKIISLLIDRQHLEVGPYDPRGTFFEAMCASFPSLLVLFGINWREVEDGEGILHQNEELTGESLTKLRLLLKWPILDRYLNGVFIRMYHVWGRNSVFSAPISLLSLLYEHEFAMRKGIHDSGITKPYLWFIRSLTDKDDGLYVVYDKRPDKLNLRQKLNLIGSGLDLDHPIALTGYFIKPHLVNETILLNTDMRSIEEIANAGAKIEIELHFALASETGHDAVHFPCGISRHRDVEAQGDILAPHRRA